MDEELKNALMTPPQQILGKEKAVVVNLASELLDAEMEGLMTLKSRSLKNFNNKLKESYEK